MSAVILAQQFRESDANAQRSEVDDAVHARGVGVHRAKDGGSRRVRNGLYRSCNRAPRWRRCVDETDPSTPWSLVPTVAGDRSSDLPQTATSRLPARIKGTKVLDTRHGLAATQPVSLVQNARRTEYPTAPGLELSQPLMIGQGPTRFSFNLPPARSRTMSSSLTQLKRVIISELQPTAGIHRKHPLLTPPSTFSFRSSSD